MKIAVIIDTWFPLVGGGQINALEISKRVAGKGHLVEIITRNNGYYKTEKIENLRITSLGPLSNPQNSFSKITFLLRAFFYLLKNDYQILHAHAFLPGITVWAASKIKGTPTILTVHGTSLHTNLNPKFKKLLEILILKTLKYSAQITVSQDFKKLANRNKKVFYIPNGVNLNSFEKTPGLKPEKPTLIFVGRLHPQKNLSALLQSIYILKKEIPAIRLSIVGEGNEKEHLKTLTRKLNLGSTVKFLGKLEGTALINAYKSSSALVLPSIYEGQPLVLLEAWASKIPVIVSKTGDCPYLVKNGSNGFLIKNCQDPQSIVSAIKRTLSNNLDKMGERGFGKVKKYYTWESSTAKTLMLYSSLIQSKSPSPKRSNRL